MSTLDGVFAVSVAGALVLALRAVLRAIGAIGGEDAP